MLKTGSKQNGLLHADAEPPEGKASYLPAWHKIRPDTADTCLQLRGNLKELLYQNPQGDTQQDRPQTGLVRLIYAHQGPDDETEEIMFCRQAVHAHVTLDARGWPDRAACGDSVWPRVRNAETRQSRCLGQCNIVPVRLHGFHG